MEGTGEPTILVTPVKYAAKETSGLKIEVKTGRNTFDFDLKSR